MELSPIRLRILVVGAGLGGLATGIALARRGHTVTIFEQARQLGEVSSTKADKIPMPPLTML